MVIWFTGQPGSGKTTLALEIIKQLDHSKFIHIDGDDLRDLMDNKDYSREGRIANIRLAQNIALFLEKKGFIPIASFVSPYRYLREDLKKKTNVIEIYVHTTDVRGKEAFFVKDYNPPTKNFINMNTTHKTIKESADEVLNVYREMATMASRS